MSWPRIRSTVPSLISTVFVLCVMLAFVADLRERARRQAALPAAQFAYQQARMAREVAESTVARLRRRSSADDALFRQFQNEVEHARADERVKKEDYDRLKGTRTRLFW